MSKKWDDDELNQQEFTLEEVLAEFGSGSRREETPEPPEREAPLPGPDLPWPEAHHREHVEERQPPEEEPSEEAPSEEEQADWREDTIPFPIPPSDDSWKDDTIPFPIRPPQPDTPPAGGKKGKVTHFPPQVLREPPVEEEPEEEEPEDYDQGEQEPEDYGEEQDADDADKVLEFPPPEPDNPVAAGLDKLRRKADEFAGHMYESEGEEEDEEVLRAQELIPGVDEEEEPPVKVRRPRRRRPPAPDTPAAELYHRYSKGLNSLRVRGLLVFLVFIAALYLTLAEQLPLPVFDALAVSGVLRCYALAGLQLLAMLLGVDTLVQSLLRPFRLRMGLDTIVALANAAVLADAITLPNLSQGDPFRQPYCAVVMLALWCVMKGNLNKRRGQRVACRTAAAAHEPYLVTRDEGAWNGRDTYAKWSGEVVGFGSQIQEEDGAERIYRVFSPLLLLACVLFSFLSSLGRNRPDDLLWCLSATLTASSALSATLCFGQPWRKLSARLGKLGAALAGWEGVVNTTGSSNILIKDTDIFPRGAVKLNGVKVYGDLSAEKVMAYTATVIRDAGGGLNIPFRDMIRSEGLLYRQGERFAAHEGGGVSEYIRGDLVQVGSASFMTLMEVRLPKGANVKNAVYCAINGQLAGLFALHYRMSGAVEPALDSLIRNRVTPVLATRDFNLIPAVLRQRFKLPADRMEFPPVERRRALSDPEREHSSTLTAVLCREGVGPYAEAVVGGRRLRVAVRLSATLTCIGAAVGSLLAFYLTFVQAYQSLTPVNLLIFLILWVVPTILLSHWVHRF